jgi:hypothetical protein
MKILNHLQGWLPMFSEFKGMANNALGGTPLFSKKVVNSGE